MRLWRDESARQGVLAKCSVVATALCRRVIRRSGHKVAPRLSEASTPMKSMISLLGNGPFTFDICLTTEGNRRSHGLTDWGAHPSRVPVTAPSAFLLNPSTPHLSAVVRPLPDEGGTSQ